MNFLSVPMNRPISVAAIGAVVCSIACSPDAPKDLSAAIGSPLPGLTAEQLDRFRAGEALFNRVFTQEEGLGPLFNENQCSACHTSPAAGGTGDQLLVRATRFTPPDRCDLLVAEGGENVRTQATPLLRAHGIERQPVPASFSERSEFTPTFLFGLGLAELVDEAELLRRADPADANGDGVSGRPGRTADGRVGRFGRKADQATLVEFIDTALRFEMGLTTRGHTDEGDIAGQPYPDGVDPAPDPEVSDELRSLLADFVRFLAPPARGVSTGEEDARVIRIGETLFTQVGCVDCHVPHMTTRRDAGNGVGGRRAPLFSDLLLHDLGPEMAGICSHGATPTEFRTAPLIGLRHRDALLHDGRAMTIPDAIRYHGGEASAARARFQSLPELQRHALLRYLATL